MNIKLSIGWLYPEHMSTYGDRGNVIILNKRLEWRGLGVEVKRITFESSEKDILACDIILGGGAQDRQQILVAKDLLKKKKFIQKFFDNGKPGLFVCGSPQLLGHWYMTGDGQKLEGLGIFDMVTKHFGHDKPRCIGNLLCKLNPNVKFQMIPPSPRLQKDKANQFQNPIFKFQTTIVGFENHGGRTYLGKDVSPFATVLKGFGNNGEDHTEGAIYKNCIATYSHGPFLSKNPHIADYLIKKALEVKYGKDIYLDPLDDTYAWNAHEEMKRRIMR
jgi:lipid II isoglutaminyl synthase (glutamine-hydrolysing)